MRISTFQFFNQQQRLMQTRQSNIADTQTQLITQERLLRASDDPVGSSRLVDLKQQLSRQDQFVRNSDRAEGQLFLQETALTSSEDSLRSARDLVIRAQNGAFSPQDLQTISQELQSIADSVLSFANSRDENGQYLFSGFQSQTQPFIRSLGAVAYQGDSGQRLLDVGENRQVAVNDPGDTVFQGFQGGNGQFVANLNTANTGSGIIDPGSVVDPAAFTTDQFRIVFTSPNQFDVVNDTTSTTVLSNQTYAEGEAILFNGVSTSIRGAVAAGDEFTLDPAANTDIFAVLDDLAAALTTPTGSNPGLQAQRDQRLVNGLNNLTQGLNHLTDTRARLGARMQVVEQQRDYALSYNTELQRIANDINGIDTAEAASNLVRELTALDAAQLSFTQIQNLSLFNYLR